MRFRIINVILQKELKKDEKEIDMLTLLEATEDIVPLTFVPCSNGVLKVC